jgi:hypothetical protein
LSFVCVVQGEGPTFTSGACHQRRCLADHNRFGASASVFYLIDTATENFLLVLGQKPNEWLSAIPVNDSVVGDVVGHLGKTLLVEVNEFVKTAFADVESGERRQEIISNEEAEKDKVVNNAF